MRNKFYTRIIVVTNVIYFLDEEAPNWLVEARDAVTDLVWNDFNGDSWNSSVVLRFFTSGSTSGLWALQGLIPIIPSTTTFTVDINRKSYEIRRRQFAITAGYAFTDYKSQGQTIEYVIIDLAPPPSGRTSPFSTYVALSRSCGRDTIRILREFERDTFLNHPSEHLRKEMERLETLSQCSF